MTTDPTQWGDEVADEMRAYFEAKKHQRYVEGVADSLMLGLLNIALAARTKQESENAEKTPSESA